MSVTLFKARVPIGLGDNVGAVSLDLSWPLCGVLTSVGLYSAFANRSSRGKRLPTARSCRFSASPWVRQATRT